MHGRWLLPPLALLLLVAPVAWAAPTVLPVASAVEFVDAGDTIRFATGSTGAPSQLNLIAPDGNTLTFQRNPATAASPTAQIWRLDGTKVSGPAAWTASTSLVGSPADGTWTISGIYISATNSASANDRPSVLLSVQGKTFEFGHSTSPNPSYNEPQLWNWRSAATTVVENGGNVPVAGTTDPVDAYEDPNNAVFFQGAGSEYTAYTLNAAVSCTPTPTMAINGAWVGASGTTFSRFTYRDGNFMGTPDLRIVALSQQTPEENEGATGSGTDIKTVPYNNAAGSSYQFMVRTDADGEALGVVAYATSGQCPPTGFPTTADVEHNNDALDVSASQAQCNGDPTTFSVTMQDNPSGLQEHLLQLFIFDANQGTLNLPANPITVLSFDTTTMRRTGAASEAHAHFIPAVLPTGNYVAWAYADYTGIGAVDYVDGAAFNVPRNTCADTPTDLTAVFTAFANATEYHDHLNEHLHVFQGNFTDYTNHVNSHLHGIEATQVDILNAFETLNFTLTCGDSANCTFSFDNTTLFEYLIEKLGPPGEPMEIAHTLLLAWIVAFFVCLRLAKLLGAGAATAGIGLTLLFGQDIMPWQLIAVGVFVLCLWLEALIPERIYQRFFKGQVNGQNGAKE